MARIAFFGAGYAGLVSGACLAELGHTVVVRDVVPERIEALEAGKVPFYEPGLEELIARNAERLSLHALDRGGRARTASFCSSASALRRPPSGDANLSAVWSVIEELPQDLEPGRARDEEHGAGRHRREGARRRSTRAA